MNRTPIQEERDAAELRACRRRIYNLRKEVSHLIRQVAELQAESPESIQDRKKELRGLESNLARVRHKGWEAASERDALRAALEALQLGPDTLTQDGLAIVLAALYPAAVPADHQGGGER